MLKKLISRSRRLLQNRVLQNILIVGGVTLFIKVVSFFKEAMVASKFGLSESLDTFFIAILVPGFISNVFLGAFKSAFIPNYIAEMRQPTGDRSSFQTTVFFITGGVSILFMIIALLISDVFLEFFFPGHDLKYYALIVEQFYYLLPCILIWGYSSLLGGLLNIDNEFLLSSLSGIFVPVVTILLLWIYFPELGYLCLALGTLIGSAISFVFLLGLAMWKGLIRLGRPNFSSSNTRIMLKQLPAKVTSGFATGMNKVVDQFFAAQLIVGSVAALNYGIKIPTFISGLLVIAITNVLLPHFSERYLKDPMNAFSNLFRILRTVFFSTMALILVGILFSDSIVAFLFERNNFTSENTLLVSRIQMFFLAYLPFSICGMVMINFLTSINRNRLMAIVSLIALALNTLLDYLLMQLYGIYGIALCTTIVIIIKNSVFFWYILRLYQREKPGHA